MRPKSTFEAILQKSSITETLRHAFVRLFYDDEIANILVRDVGGDIGYTTPGGDWAIGYRRLYDQVIRGHLQDIQAVYDDTLRELADHKKDLADLYSQSGGTLDGFVKHFGSPFLQEEESRRAAAMQKGAKKAGKMKPVMTTPSGIQVFDMREQARLFQTSTRTEGGYGYDEQFEEWDREIELQATATANIEVASARNPAGMYDTPWWSNTVVTLKERMRMGMMTPA